MIRYSRHRGGGEGGGLVLSIRHDVLLFSLSSAKLILKKEANCISYRLVDSEVTKEHNHRSYCKYILGRQTVMNRTSKLDNLYDADMWRYQYAKHFGRLFLNPHKGAKFNKPSEVNKCFKQIDDIYCHYYYKRCYFDSDPQLICREACEELEFKNCQQLFKKAAEMNKSTNRRIYPYYWVIINCTVLPFRNETTNCYYPDHEKGW